MAVLQSLITVVIFVLMLGILVVLHEFGHFLVARLSGIRVHEFGIGMPPRARVLHRGPETVYTLNWLPIGGFVRLEGEDGDSDDERSFTAARLPVKVLVLVAGAVMNLVLALALLTGIAWLPQTSYGLAFHAVQAGSPAAAAGIVPGDLIVALDGRRFDQLDAQAFVTDLRAGAGRRVVLGIVKGGAPATDGSASPTPSPVATSSPGAPAGAASIVDVPVTLRSASEIDAQHGALGIEQLTYVPSALSFTRSPAEAVEVGAARTSDAFLLTIRGFGQLADSIVTRPTEAPPAAGPIGIAVVVGDVFWQAGLAATIYLAAILSANLALLNILPFPPLDGGRVLMTLIKAVAGTRVSIRAERLTYLVGFAFLFVFLIWVTAFDLARLGGVIQ